MFLADLLLFNREKVFLHLSFDKYSLYSPESLLLLRGRGDTADEVESAVGVSEFLIDLQKVFIGREEMLDVLW